MEKADLYDWIENSNTLSENTLTELSAAVDDYPYFHSARLLYTKNLHQTNNQKYEEELGKTAVLCNDRRRLFYLIYKEEYEKLLLTDQDSHPKKGDRTEELLDSFLSSLGEKDMIDPMVENVQINLVTTDYFSYLQSLSDDNENEQQGEKQELQHHDIIDAFIEKAATEPVFVPKETITPVSKQQESDKEEGSEFLTETLARIYIKQKKYAQALTIIKRLSLNFPKKSVYFAHQIRFLEMLIINEKNKNK